MQLVVVGRPGWNSDSILGRVDELGLTGRVVRLGQFPDDSLPRLMASAAAVVYPSRYEGFGLPVLESMATGAPVAASDLPVFREIGGEVIEYFDPERAEDLGRCHRAGDRQSRRSRSTAVPETTSGAIRLARECRNRQPAYPGVPLSGYGATVVHRVSGRVR